MSSTHLREEERPCSEFDENEDRNEVKETCQSKGLIALKNQNGRGEWPLS